MRGVAVAGMAFGDEGKGLATDYFTEKLSARLVVRYNGGSQAAHNVIRDGVHHTFSQFGSGSLAGAATHLSRHMLVDPLALVSEARVLKEKLGEVPRLSISPDSVVILPIHLVANRMRESQRGDARHGSVGMGVGEARGDSLRGLSVTARGLWSPNSAGLIEEIRDAKIQEGFESELLSELDCFGLAASLRSSILDSGAVISSLGDFSGAIESVVFEGAQGVLLDEEHGFAPYNSWTDCTFSKAEELAKEIGCHDLEKVGVFRTYFTRHGPGPFPTEDESVAHQEAHNGQHEWMGPFRQGHFDMNLAQYAASCAPPDSLFLTHWDRESTAIATGYGGISRTSGTEAMLSAKPMYATRERGNDDLAEMLGDRIAPVRWVSSGPSAEKVRAI